MSDNSRAHLNQGIWSGSEGDLLELSTSITLGKTLGLPMLFAGRIVDFNTIADSITVFGLSRLNTHPSPFGAAFIAYLLAFGVAIALFEAQVIAFLCLSCS